MDDDDPIDSTGEGGEMWRGWDVLVAAATLGERQSTKQPCCGGCNESQESVRYVAADWASRSKQ